MVTGIEEGIGELLTNPKAVARALSGVNKMLSRIRELEHIISGDLKITGKLIEIACPENVGVYTFYFRPQVGFINNDFRFKAGNIINASITSVEGLSKVPEAVKIPEDGGGATVHLKELDPKTLYSLKLTYKLDNSNFLDDLVFMHRQLDSADDEGVGKYWMTAGLKCPEVLEQEGYKRIDISDLDFEVDVGINNEINTAIPRTFKNQIEILSKLAGPRPSRDVWAQATNELYKLKGEKYGEKELNTLASLQELFVPNHFKKFIEVREDFNYTDCLRGANIYDLPINIWPKFMTIVSRTDLRLDNPVSKGMLIYKKKEFISEVKKKFK